MPKKSTKKRSTKKQRTKKQRAKKKKREAFPSTKRKPALFPGMKVKVEKRGVSLNDKRQIYDAYLESGKKWLHLGFVLAANAEEAKKKAAKFVRQEVR